MLNEWLLWKLEACAIFPRETPLESAEQARHAVEQYVKLQLACPFLEDDARSIHPQRPFVCRQYLVTSDPALCDDPLHNDVEVVPMPMQPAHAMLSTTEQFLHLEDWNHPPGAGTGLCGASPELEQQVPMKEGLQFWLKAVAT